MQSQATAAGFKNSHQGKSSELDLFINTNQDAIMDVAYKVETKIKSENEKCIGISNEDKFISCLKKADSQFGNLQKKFQYRLHYWMLQTEYCFKDNKNDKESCKQTARKNIQNYLESFVSLL